MMTPSELEAYLIVLKMNGVIKATIDNVSIEFEPNYRAMADTMKSQQPNDDELLFSAAL
jgi:hypothetical protein